MKSLQEIPKQKIRFASRLCFFLCVFAIVCVPRMSSLDAHWSNNEALWLSRSAKFMSVVKQGNFSETLIAHHPGVTTMWIAGLRALFAKPNMDVKNLARARWCIGIFVWVSIGVACLLIYRLFGQWIAYASFACLAYSPLFLAQTRSVHTDALAATFILRTCIPSR